MKLLCNNTFIQIEKRDNSNHIKKELVSALEGTGFNFNKNNRIN